MEQVRSEGREGGRAGEGRKCRFYFFILLTGAKRAETINIVASPLNPFISFSAPLPPSLPPSPHPTSQTDGHVPNHHHQRALRLPHGEVPRHRLLQTKMGQRTPPSNLRQQRPHGSPPPRRLRLHPPPAHRGQEKGEPPDDGSGVYRKYFPVWLCPVHASFSCQHLRNGRLSIH